VELHIQYYMACGENIMVTITREPIGYCDGWSYEITAYVPHDWASKKFNKINGHGHSSITTAYDDVTLFSLNDTDPKFEEHLAWLIKECTEMENHAIGKIEVQISELQAKRVTLIKRNRGKYARTG